MDLRWALRLGLALCLLGLSIIGFLLLKVHAGSYLIYTLLLGILYPLSAITLAQYISDTPPFGPLFWTQLLHWSVYLLSLYVMTVLMRLGAFSPTQTGLTNTLLLGLTAYLYGIYHEVVFIFLGLTLIICTMSMITLAPIPLFVSTAVVLLAAAYVIKRAVTSKAAQA